MPLGQEAWLTVTFNGNTSPTYHPRVRMTAGSGEFAFDITTNCAGGLLTCGTEGGTSTRLFDWETFLPAGNGYDNPIPAVSTIYVHVYRRVGLPLSCNNYTLSITN